MSLVKIVGLCPPTTYTPRHNGRSFPPVISRPIVAEERPQPSSCDRLTTLCCLVANSNQR